MSKPGKILIIDDEKDIRSLMQEIFDEEGYQVYTAANGQQAQNLWRTYSPDVIFLDIWMPDIDGITLLKQMIEQDLLTHCSVIMISGHGTIDTAIEATKLGAYDFLEKPLSLAKLLITAERAMDHLHLHSENRQLRQKLPLQVLPVGKSRLIQKLRETIERLSKYTMPVLITGEAGAGKHHIARAIHKVSERQNKPMFEVDARILDEQLALDIGDDCSQSPFFAELIRADGGAVILTHAEQLSNDGQSLFKGIINEQSFTCPKTKQNIQLDVRIYALSHDGLEAQIQIEDFDAELYQRLTAIPVEVPALRQHTEDIPELIQYFLDYFLSTEGLQYREFSLGAQNTLRQYNWPGNFRELQNLIQRLLILGDGEVTDEEAKQAIEALQPNNSVGLNHIDTSLPLKEAKDHFERAYFKRLLVETGGNVTETAKRSGVERTNLYRKLKTLGLDPKNPK